VVYIFRQQRLGPSWLDFTVPQNRVYYRLRQLIYTLAGVFILKVETKRSPINILTLMQPSREVVGGTQIGIIQLWRIDEVDRQYQIVPPSVSLIVQEGFSLASTMVTLEEAGRQNRDEDLGGPDRLIEFPQPRITRLDAVDIQKDFETLAGPRRDRQLKFLA
jgi:hypothetical protein